MNIYLKGLKIYNPERNFNTSQVYSDLKAKVRTMFKVLLLTIHHSPNENLTNVRRNDCRVSLFVGDVNPRFLFN